jgi:hypothetical protein
MNGIRQLACWLILIAVALAAIAPVGAQDDAIPVRPAPRWWKGNLHTHTLWSDGDDFPEMVAEWYRVRGYNFLALTDHNVLSQGMRWMKATDIARRGGENVLKKYQSRFGPDWVETRGSPEAMEVRLKPLDEFRALVEERGKFLMIPAEEISDRAQGVPVHINASNLRDVVEPLGGETVRQAIENNIRNVEEQAKQAGREILAHLNHPNFQWAISAEDLAHVVTDRFFEVYNGHPDVHQPGDPDTPGRPSVERIWDIANTIRLAHLKAPPLFGVATDDSHHYHQKPNGSRPGRGWTMVRSTHLTPEYIIKAIKAGDFYASSGVTLSDVRYDRQRRIVEIAIAPDQGATFVTQFIGTLKGVDTSSQPPTDQAGKPLRGTGKYSDQVGQILATVTGLSSKYQLKGNELYVRAVITSSLDPVDPSFKGQKQQAWTQPVGWESVIEPAAAAGR